MAANQRISRVFSYFCIVHLPGSPDREICVIAANDDTAALSEMNQVGRRWPGFETVVLYDGERVLGVLSNPRMGFASDGLGDEHLGVRFAAIA